jgi:hypothetical protein
MLVLLWADWTQTQTIARNPGTWRELNPILGAHPSPAAVSLYFIVVAIAAVLFVQIRHRLIVPALCCMIVVQAAFVGRNIYLGL